MGVTLEMLKKIKAEIVNDPDNIGYAGKTNAEIATLLSSSRFISRTVIDAHPSPLNKILRGVADGVNIISDTEVAQAKVTI